MSGNHRYQEAQAVVASLLGDASALTSRYLPDVDAYYFYRPIRGGEALIVGVDGTFLFATSLVTPEVHEQAFAQGRRTDPTVMKASPGSWEE